MDWYVPITNRWLAAIRQDSRLSGSAQRAAAVIADRFIAENPAYATFKDVDLRTAMNASGYAAQAAREELVRKAWLVHLQYLGRFAPYYKLGFGDG